jgi:hypothetical protein
MFSTTPSVCVPPSSRHIYTQPQVSLRNINTALRAGHKVTDFALLKEILFEITNNRKPVWFTTEHAYPAEYFKEGFASKKLFCKWRYWWHAVYPSAYGYCPTYDLA